MAKERKTGRPASHDPPPHETLRLSASGAGMLLGELEHLLMETAWKLGRPASARQLHAKIVRARAIELITVVTVLNRLVSPKRLMRREKVDDLFHYSPVLSREEFMQRASRHVVERVLALGHEAVTASMVDVLAEKDPDLLAELGRRVRQRLRDAGRNK